MVSTSRMILVVMVSIIFLPVLSIAGTVDLRPMGQTTLYCPDEGNVQMGVPWPSLRFVDNGNAKMTDNRKAEDKREILQKAHALQIPFIENKGQIKDKGVKYYAKTFGGSVFITKEGEIVYSLLGFNNQQAVISRQQWKMEALQSIPYNQREDALHMVGNPNAQGWGIIKEILVGTSISDVKGEEKSPTKVSYFKGENPSEWQRNIPTYNLVSFGEIYKGIELKLKAYGKSIEKIFYVKPNAKVEKD